VVDLGLLTLAPGAAPEAVLDELKAALPPDVMVLTKAGLIEREKAYWAESTPIGFVITSTLIVGMIVGAISLYQILYTDVTDHMWEFATLKAIGYSDRRLFAVVFMQAVLLALLAYPLAWALSVGLYAAAHRATLLPINVKSVVLPDPEGPVTMTTSPGDTSSVLWNRTCLRASPVPKV
jgi:putative ABC transport system permease protein